MIHLKKEYKENLLGIMIFVKATSGIGIDHAREICFSFDKFFGIPSHKKHDPLVWDELVSIIIEFLTE